MKNKYLDQNRCLGMRESTLLQIVQHIDGVPPRENGCPCDQLRYSHATQYQQIHIPKYLDYSSV